METGEAIHYLLNRSAQVFDSKSGAGRGGVRWSVKDANAVRQVLWELRRRVNEDEQRRRRA